MIKLEDWVWDSLQFIALLKKEKALSLDVTCSPLPYFYKIVYLMTQ
jgi:hypothetical protein